MEPIQDTLTEMMKKKAISINFFENKNRNTMQP